MAIKFYSYKSKCVDGGLLCCLVRWLVNLFDSRISSLERLFFYMVKSVDGLIDKDLEEVMLGKDSWLASMSNAIDQTIKNTQNVARRDVSATLVQEEKQTKCIQ